MTLELEEEFNFNKNVPIIFYYEMYSDGKYRCIEDELPFELPNGWKMCTYW